MKKITLLGATGSIGNSTLNVIALNNDKYQLHAAVGNKNVKAMLDVIKKFKPSRVAMCDAHASLQLKEACSDLNLNVDILSGTDGICEIAGDGEAQQVVSAIVGAAGLAPTLEAVKKGCEIGLANKESLVMTGRLFFDLVKEYKATVLPVDSEHSAIFQSLPEGAQQNLGFCDLKSYGVHKIILTGSGGPFRDKDLSEFKDITPHMAINHPVWNMGPKISVDSATMMNKGLEFIEARYLFNAPDAMVDVVIHPQSIVHSMVSYVDGAVVAELGNPSMQTPIARSLAYPKRIASGIEPLDFVKVGSLSFKPADFKRYPCLKLAMEASKLGQGATTALNAANEVLVDSFLQGHIHFLDIATQCAYALEHFSNSNAYSLEEILDIDAKARDFVAKRIN